MAVKTWTDKDGGMKCQLCGMAVNALVELETGNTSIKLCQWCVHEMDSSLNTAVHQLILEATRERQGGARPKC